MTETITLTDGSTMVISRTRHKGDDTFQIVEEYPKLATPIELNPEFRKGWLVTLTDGNVYAVPLGTLRRWLHLNAR